MYTRNLKTQPITNKPASAAGTENVRKTEGGGRGQKPGVQGRDGRERSGRGAAGAEHKQRSLPTLPTTASRYQHLPLPGKLTSVTIIRKDKKRAAYVLR